MVVVDATLEEVDATVVDVTLPGTVVVDATVVEVVVATDVVLVDVPAIGLGDEGLLPPPHEATNTAAHAAHAVPKTERIPTLLV